MRENAVARGAAKKMERKDDDLMMLYARIEMFSTRAQMQDGFLLNTNRKRLSMRCSVDMESYVYELLHRALMELLSLN